ncbi:AraC family transcriptional regulator [Myroides odoratimimus]|uniref:helix-turn-helix domain-containing protein n=1 Tax=Myroides odoratimimus TaxID=76832 RepID=UPI00310152EF
MKEKKQNINYQDLITFHQRGKFFDLLFDIGDKQGTMKIYQGTNFIITDTQFSTKEDTLLWSHINREGLVEFNFVVKGSFIQSQEGLFDQLVYPQGSHNWLYNPLKKETNQLIGQGEYQFISIYLKLEYFTRLLSLTPLYFNQINLKAPWVKHGHDARLSKRLLYLLRNLWDSPISDKLHRLYFESTVNQVFCEQIELLFTKTKQTKENLFQRQDVEKLHRVASLIEQNLYNPICITTLSKTSGLNEYKLKKGFKQLYGMSMTNYLQNVRMSKAKILLQETDKTISEIAYELGFSHSQHFHRAFKKTFDTVPSVFKKNSR